MLYHDDTHEGPVEFEQLVRIEYFLRVHNLVL